MSDTTSKTIGNELDKILGDEYLTNSTRRELEEYIKQYGIQERIAALTELKQSYHDNIVSDDRMDLEINEALTALKDKKNK